MSAPPSSSRPPVPSSGTHRVPHFLLSRGQRPSQPATVCVWPSGHGAREEGVTRLWLARSLRLRLRALLGVRDGLAEDSCPFGGEPRKLIGNSDMKGSWRLPIRGRPRGLGVPVEKLVPEEGKHLQEASRPAQSRPLHPLLWQRPPKGAEVGKESTQAACAEGREGEEESGEERGRGGRRRVWDRRPRPLPVGAQKHVTFKHSNKSEFGSSLIPRTHRCRQSTGFRRPASPARSSFLRSGLQALPRGGARGTGKALLSAPGPRADRRQTEQRQAALSVHLQIPAPALPCGPTAGEGCSRRPPFKTALGGWPGPARR